MENETNIGSLVNEIEGQIEEKIQALQADYQLQRAILLEGFRSEAHQETHVYLEQELADLRTSVLQSESQSKWKVKKTCLFAEMNWWMVFLMKPLNNSKHLVRLKLMMLGV